MIDFKKLHLCLENVGIEFITGVPDSLLNEFCLYVGSEWPHERHVIAANEGNAIALATGFHLAMGSVPLVYMQNSGIGNAMNPLLSLTNKDVYAIPMILLIGWRGDPDIKDHAQHLLQGKLTPSLLEAMDIPFRILTCNDEEVCDAVKWAAHTALNKSGPTALIAKKGIFEKGKKTEVTNTINNYSMSRENAIECLIKYLPKNTIFVATTGRATRELYSLRTINGMSHNLDFLNVGAMGHTSQIAAGIALGAKKQLVVCLDGDGAAIMHLGGLTTIGKLGLPNLLHVVLNNGAHESVGGQPTAGLKIDLTSIAKNSRYKIICKAIETESALQEAIRTFMLVGGPAFIDIHIRKGIRSNLGPLDVVLDDLKNKFKLSINRE